MNKKLTELYQQLKQKGLSAEQEELITRELNHKSSIHYSSTREKGLYDDTDFENFMNLSSPERDAFSYLKTLDELLEQDKKREADGFPRKIRIGKIVKPTKDNKAKVVVVPSTNEPKFYHDDSITEDGEENTGGSGDGEEGDVIGEQQAQPEEGEGEGQGAGEGQSAGHDISSDAFDLGRIITEKFELPNLKTKGNKRSFTKYTYDLTDRNRRFGQVLDKKATMKKIIGTNIVLENIKPQHDFNPADLIINPNDEIYRILSKEKDFESQAVVFFLRDYSGSMQGSPTEVIGTQHLLIYSWLMFQYQNNVQTRFILHDTEAKEVADFYTYYKSQVAGGTRVAPAFQLVNKIVAEENLATDNNIYVFHGTDGDDWDSDGKALQDELEKMLLYANRVGITVAKNSWSSSNATTIEKTMESSGLLKNKSDLIRLDVFTADGASEERIIEGIKNIVS
ncbi:MAG TPA: hypothetical protein DDX39_04940 [Bacteroidales bacterium]|nr:MAG: hypothetical protein A2W98_04165 [Bacteroidetes bacterium GWF2_33_38]OFY89071.1 MAG: hypothetical protein A2236_10975 [Bacteroidetes bacterium RIFOXYA2_FULL_33_7]HBF87971.1 hypothetical protein [Bacteroidales bacterium]